MEDVPQSTLEMCSIGEGVIQVFFSKYSYDPRLDPRPIKGVTATIWLELIVKLIYIAQCNG